MHIDFVVQQFGPQRIGEAANRVLGAAVGRLGRNTSIGERRSNLSDGAAVSWNHITQRGQRCIDDTEIGDFGNPLEFVRSHLQKGEKTETIALLTQTSIGPSSRS